MSEQTTEHVQETHTDAPAAPTTEMHVGEQLGELRARVDDLDTWRMEHMSDHAPKATVIEEEIEEVEQTAEMADVHAEIADDHAEQAEETAEVAVEVAVVAAVEAAEAEETAEEAEDIALEVDDGANSDPVVEVPVEEEAPVSESDNSSSRKRRRGVYGRR